MVKFLVIVVMVLSITTQAYSQIEWTKYPNNPVLKRGANGTWDDQLIANPYVLFDGSKYHMWYSGYDGNGTSIGYASSSDKINWTKHSNPVLDNGPGGSWDDFVVYQPSVIFDGDMYHMWFAGHNGPNNRQIGYATSPDSISWTKHTGNPVMRPGSSGNWDDLWVDSPEVLFIDGVYHMWYSGSDGTNTQTGHAISPDGINWTKDSLNPVLKSGATGEWDTQNVTQPTVLIDQYSVYHMFYSGGVQFEWSMGYAYSMDGYNWIKYSGNPVLTPGVGGSWDDTFTGLAGVLFNEDSTGFDMWYTGSNSNTTEGWEIGYASAPFGEPKSFDNTWYRYPDNPVFKGRDGAWDRASVYNHSIIFDEETYHMWYSGYDGENSGSRIGYAYSDNGMEWERENNPVLNKGTNNSWDNFSVQQPCVLYDGTTWHMWYTGINTAGLATRRIGYATSPDSISWTKYGNNPVLEPGQAGSWDEQWVGWCKVLFVNGRYHMWYSGGNGTEIQIGHATSRDGITWQKDPFNPVLTLGSSGAWDDLTITNPAILYDGQTFHLWYGGAQTVYGDWKTGYAVSVDGRHWKKISEESPVMDLGSAGAWDDKYVTHGIEIMMEIVDGDTLLKMWYGGGAEVNKGSIGFAASDVFVSVEDDNLNVIPGDFSLSQNYPNPFNPTTTINYSLSHTSDVKIEIFNILGSKVATLDNTKKSAGTHTINFNASNLPSGVYLYRIQAGEYIDVKKMVLMK